MAVAHTSSVPPHFSRANASPNTVYLALSRLVTAQHFVSSHLVDPTTMTDCHDDVRSCVTVDIGNTDMLLHSDTSPRSVTFIGIVVDTQDNTTTHLYVQADLV